MLRHLVCGAAVATLLAGNAAAAIKHLYTFNDGTAMDTAVGGTAHGTLEGGALIINGQLALPGGNASSLLSQHVALPAATIGINAYTQTTLELWTTVNPNFATNTFSWAVGFGRNGDVTDVGSETFGHDYLMMNVTRVNDGGRAAISSDYFNAETGFTGPVLTGGQKHLALTVNSAGVDNTTVSFYVNGSLIGTGTGPHDLADVSNALAYLGRSLYNGDQYFAGLINEFRIHDTALTQAQVQSSFAAGPAGAAGPTLTINRASGAISLSNPGASLRISGYAINSPLGTLDAANWNEVSGTTDAPPAFFGTGNGSFDSDDLWTIASSTPTSLAEESTADAVGNDDGAPLGNLSLGTGVWRKYYQEDVTATIRVHINPTTEITIPAAVVFTGGPGNQAYKRSDFNFDGTISGLDYAALRTNILGTLAPGLTDIDSYILGDLDGDQDVDFLDFRLFQGDYDAVNGVGALAILISTVPEPNSMVLIATGLGVMLQVRRRRPC